MQKISNGKYHITHDLIVAIISVLISLVSVIPLFLVAIYAFFIRNKLLPFILALMLSIIISQFSPPPDYDIYRHYQSYLKFMDTGEPLYMIKEPGLRIIFSIGKFFILGKEFILFVSSFFCIYTIVFFWREISIRENFNNFQKLFLLFFFIMFFPFSFVTPIRFPIGVCLFSLGFYFFYVKSNFKLGCFLLALAPIIHVSFLFLLFATFLSKYLKIFIGRWALFFSILFSTFLLLPIISNVFLLVENLSGVYLGAEAYTTGVWGSERFDLVGLNFYGRMYEWLNVHLYTFIALIYMLENRQLDYKNSALKSLSFVFVLVSLFISLPVVYGRFIFSIAFIYVIICYRPIKIKTLNSSLFILITIITMGLFVRIIEFRNMRPFLIAGYQQFDSFFEISLTTLLMSLFSG